MSLKEILNELSRADFFDIANQPVNEADYLLASVLPTQNRASYNAVNGRIKVVSTVAGETAMDSPYARGGHIEMNVEDKPTAKFTQSVDLGEQEQRRLVEMVDQIRLGNTPGNAQDFSRNFLLNWLDKILAQSITDRNELLRGEALSTGQLALRGGAVTFGVPAGNMVSYAAGDGFGGASSKFWQAVRLGNRTVRNVRARIMSFDTLDMILDNDVNKIAVVSDATSSNGLVRRVSVRKVGTNERFSPDVRDSTTLIGYDRRVNLNNPAGSPIETQVIPDGKVIFVGENTVDMIDEAGTIITRPGLGVTHQGPTVEGGGAPGVFLNAYVPQGREYSAVADVAENIMTVLNAPEKLFIATTDVA